MIIISVYCPIPSLKLDEILMDLKTFLLDYQEDIILICGDFNAKSILWGPRNSDDRGHKVVDFINRNTLDIINDPNSLPTYSSILGFSWIDLLLTKNLKLGKIKNWTISDRVNNHDHNYMKFDMVDNGMENFKSPRWAIENISWINFKNDISRLINKFKGLELNTENIEVFIEKFEDEVCIMCGK